MVTVVMMIIKPSDEIFLSLCYSPSKFSPEITNSLFQPVTARLPSPQPYLHISNTILLKVINGLQVFLYDSRFPCLGQLPPSETPIYHHMLLVFFMPTV